MTDESLRIETVALSEPDDYYERMGDLIEQHPIGRMRRSNPDRDKAVREALEVIRTHKDTLYTPTYLVSLLQRLVN